MKASLKTAIAVVIAAAAVASGVYVYSLKGQESLTVYVADAYTGEAQFLISEFHNKTSVPVEPPVSGGSYTDAREISGGAPASVFISVALNAYTSSFLGSHSPTWALAFASDSMVIAYSNLTMTSTVNNIVSLFRDAYDSNSSLIYREAFSNLTSGNVKIGISDPISDPAGYRAWIVMEIAGSVLTGNETYFTGRIQGSHSNVTASSAADLVSPLETGQIQFLFIYKSAAITKGLHYVPLNDTFNLGNASLASFYSRFQYSAEGQTFTGTPVLLFASVPANESTSSIGMKFISFLINNTAPLSGFGLILLSTMLLYGSSSSGVLQWALDNSRVVQAGAL
ncbi:substrate-binding domain-containing protein [Thermoplasmatales archaeon AK]|nr:substrate-binding domain-containing protein [Thermoplasmatales archaeon AK]